MKVALVFPRTKYVSGDPPLGLMYIAAYVRKAIKDLDIIILDSTFARSLTYVTEGLKNFKPDIVGIFCDTLMFNNVIHIAEFAKEINSFVVIGGPHATVFPESLSDKSNMVVKGEGEEAFLEIIKKFDKGNLSQKILEFSEKRISNLDNIPFPDFDLLDMDNYLSTWNYLDSVDIGLKGTTIITSRGCPFKCSYCQPTLDLLFGSMLRRRTPENVVNEISHLIDRFSIKGIFFHDDTFTMDRKWIFEFLDLMERKNIKILWGCNSRINTVDQDMLEEMHKTGLRTIHFGIESGSQRVLDEVYQKKINLNNTEKVLKLTKKIGIHTFGFFMIGAPSETIKEINSTIDLACRLPLDEATFSITTPLLGTFLYDMVKNDPGYEMSKDFRDFDYYRNTSIRKGPIPISKLKYLQKKALVLFYLHPRRIGYILRHLFSIKGLKKLLIKIKRFI